MKKLKSFILSIIARFSNKEVIFGLIDEEEPKYAAFGCKRSYGGGGC